MRKKIRMGDTVKSKISGFKGVVVSKTQFLNGCVQFGIEPKVNNKNLTEGTLQEMSVDERSLVLVKPRNEKDYEYLEEMQRPDEFDDDEDDNYSNGGPNRLGLKMKGH